MLWRMRVLVVLRGWVPGRWVLWGWGSHHVMRHGVMLRVGLWRHTHIEVLPVRRRRRLLRKMLRKWRPHRSDVARVTECRGWPRRTPHSVTPHSWWWHGWPGMPVHPLSFVNVCVGTWVTRSRKHRMNHRREPTHGRSRMGTKMLSRNTSLRRWSR